MAGASRAQDVCRICAEHGDRPATRTAPAGSTSVSSLRRRCRLSIGDGRGPREHNGGTASGPQRRTRPHGVRSRTRGMTRCAAMQSRGLADTRCTHCTRSIPLVRFFVCSLSLASLSATVPSHDAAWDGPPATLGGGDGVEHDTHERRRDALDHVGHGDQVAGANEDREPRTSELLRSGEKASSDVTTQRAAPST